MTLLGQQLAFASPRAGICGSQREIAIEPKAQADQQGLSKTLQAMLREDPSLRTSQDADSGQTILWGMGELQLKMSVEKLRTKCGVAVAADRAQSKSTIYSPS